MVCIDWAFLHSEDGREEVKRVEAVSRYLAMWYTRNTVDYILFSRTFLGPWDNSLSIQGRQEYLAW